MPHTSPPGWRFVTLHPLHSLLEKEAVTALKESQSFSDFSSLNSFEGSRCSLRSKNE